ncbi:hypothetical protein FOA52_014924 [Chlamydomonas sp. UWO 241]|nr:hypothetical protein FOA52_014924 [Chlamydomonas sp. UWO 241]
MPPQGYGIGAYMADFTEHFDSVKLPLGAKVQKSPTGLGLDFPRFQMFDVWVEPHVNAEVSVLPDHVEAKATTADCIITGSSHVEALKLNERFDLQASVVFTWTEAAGKGQQAVITTKSDIVVQVDVPPPFSFIPKPALQATVDAALAAVLPVMRDAFIRGLVTRYATWVANRLPTKALEKAKPGGVPKALPRV